MQRRLPLRLRNTRLTSDDLITVLGYASLNRSTIESSCHSLESAPSGNRLREVLMAALPTQAVLQRQLNTMLRDQLPAGLLIGRRGYTIAMDLTQIPYHGQPDESEDEIMRSGMRSGTTHFHGYATACIVHDRQRYVLALYFVQLHDAMYEIVRKLLDRVKALKLRLRRVLLDKGFCSAAVFRLLDQRRLAYITPLSVRGRSGGVRRLLRGRLSYFTTYTLHGSGNRPYTVRAVVVCRYNKGRYRRRGIARFAYAVAGLSPSIHPSAVFELYRQRFAIETSYRQMHQVRARTTSRNPVLRLLLVGIAFTLVNLYVFLRSTVHFPSHRVYRFTLIRLADLLIRAVLAWSVSHAKRPLTSLSVISLS
jgi:putative transposase